MPGLSYELRIIFAEEFRRQVRNKGFMFFTVLIVVVMVAAIPVTSLVVNLFEDAQEEGVGGTAAPAPASDDVGGIESTFGYVDPAGILPGAAKTESSLREFDGRDEGIEAVRRGEIDTLFVLPADYVESGRIEDYWTTRDRGPVWANNGEAESYFRAFLKEALIYGRQFPPSVDRAFDTGYFEQFDVEEDASAIEESGANVAQGLVELLALILFGVLLMIAVMTGGGTIIRSVAEEKETRMVEMLITSASPISILTGKLMAVVLAGLMHIAIWILVGAFATPAILDQVPGAGELTISARSLVIVAFCFVLGYVLFSAFSMFVGTVVSSSAEGQRQTGLLSVLVGLPIWLVGLIINVPDFILLKVLTYVPFTAPTMIMMRLAAGSELSNVEVAIALALVAVAALVMTWIAARTFSVGILLSGQSITSPRSLLAAIRGSD